MTRLPRVLVLTAHGDEPQLAQLGQAVALQRGVEVEHRWRRCSSFREAQRWFQAEALGASTAFEWVLILDDDMMPVDRHAVARLVRCAEHRGERARLATPVYDHYSRTQIMGVHLLAPSTVTDIMDDTPVVHDAWIGRIPGTFLRWVDAPQVRHAPEPSLQQAVRFGLQRGNKARRARRAEDYWMLLYRLAHIQRHVRDATSTAVLFAAIVALDPSAFGRAVSEAMETFDEHTQAAVTLVSSKFRDDADLVAQAIARVGHPFAIAREHVRYHGASADVVRAYLRERYLALHSPVTTVERMRPRWKRVEPIAVFGDTPQPQRD